MEERIHILKVLKKVEIALKRKDYFKIKNLSNEMLHTASIHQDPYVISTAVIIYSLSKIIERQDYQLEKNWLGFYERYTKSLDNMIKALEKDNLKKFRREIAFIRSLIQKLSGDLSIYLNEVFRKAQVNKASRIYEHGISMEKTAKILGISLWELSEYAGKTRIADINLSVTMPIKQRIEIVEEMFE